MRNLKSFVLTMLLALFSNFSASAFVVGNLSYDLVDYNKNYCSVKLYDRNYSGAIEIPSTVVYDNKTYTVTEIQFQGFYNCKNITSVTLPNTIKSIPAFAFAESGISSIKINEGVEVLNQGAFSHCNNLTNITLPNSIKKIGPDVFSECTALEYVKFPSNLEKIYQKAFYRCSKLKEISLPNTLTDIDSEAFYGCTSLEYLIIPNKITTITSSSFRGCTNVKFIDIPESVSTIQAYAFYGCTNLLVIFSYNSTPPTCQDLVFYGCKSNCCVVTPYRNAYMTAKTWKDFYIFDRYISKIEISKSSVSLKAGETTTLSATVSPSTAFYAENIEWSSSNTSVATVKDGMITAIGAGTATIKVAATDGSGVYATCTVTVTSSNGNQTTYDYEAKAGSSFNLPITITCSKKVSGFQFNLALPAGVSVTGCTMSDKANGLTASYNYNNGLYKFSVLSFNGQSISCDGSVVMTLTISVDKSVADGYYDMLMRDGILFADDGDEISVANNPMILKVITYIIGDVNGNGTINTNDAIAIVNYVIGKSQTTFIAEAADVNGNGSINTNDAIAIVNYVIGKTNSLRINSNVSEVETRAGLNAAINLGNVNVNKDGKAVLPISIACDKPLSGFEFYLALPEGVTVESNDLTEQMGNHIVSSNFNDGVYKYSALSLSGATIAGNNDVVINVNLNTSTLKDGAYTISLTHATVFAEDGDEISVTDVSSVLNATTGIIDINADLESTDAYDLQGRKVISPRNGVYIKNGKKVIVK